MNLRGSASRPGPSREADPIPWEGDDASGFHRAVAAIANGLAHRPGTRWALVCEDTHRFAVGFTALAEAGRCIVLPQSPQSASVAESGAEALLTDTPERYPELPCLDVRTPGPATVGRAHIAGDDQIVELFTSGSTGRPKCVEKTLGQLRAEVASLERHFGHGLEDAAVIATVPHHHLYGLLFRVLWPLWHGRRFHARTLTQTAELNAVAARYGRCLLVSSPAFLTRVPDFHASVPSGCAEVFCSGAPLPSDTASRMEAAHGRSATEIYGSTETGGIAWRRQSRATGDAWRTFDAVETEIVEGILRVRSPWTDRADWVDTGDRAEALPERRLRLLGRADGVVKLEDKRLSLVEMEGRLRQLPWVEEARVVLLPGRRTLLGAVVVLTPAGRTELAVRGRRALRESLATPLRAYYGALLTPRKWRFVEALPVNDMGKVEAARLHALFSRAHTDGTA